jgi:hypothetical protein
VDVQRNTPGLVREPIVADADTMIDRVVVDIPIFLPPLGV